VSDKPPAVLHRMWRVGRHTGRTLWARSGEAPTDDDVLIGTMDSPTVAAHVVEVHNAWLEGRADG
jgi:hypothetical protein